MRTGVGVLDVPSEANAIRVPLAVNLFTIMGAILLVLVTALAGFILIESRRTAEETGRALCHELTEKVAQRIEKLFSPAAVLADLSSFLPDTAQPPDLLVHPMGWYIMRALESYDAVYSAYMGYENGAFYQIIVVGGASEPEHDELAVAEDEQEALRGVGEGIRVAHDAPPGTRFLQRTILTQGVPRPLEIWTYFDSDRVMIGSRVVAATYDPRTRSWYRMARRTTGTVLSDIYTFASLGLPGLTLARAFDGDLPGVFGVDLTLDGIADYLAAQALTPNGRLLVATVDGRVVAYRGPDGMRTGVERIRDRPLGLSDLRDPAITRALIEPDVDQGVRLVTTRTTGEAVLVRRMAVTMPGGKNLVVAMAAPLSDFTEPVDDLIGRSLVFAVVLASVGLPVIVILALRMSAALGELARDAGRIRDFDLTGIPRVRTIVREVQDLALAHHMMKTSLRTFGLYVPKDLVRQILAAGGSAEPGGQRRELSILFTDIADFTTLSETAQAEDLMVRTSQYFEEVTGVISARGGVIDKFIGDAVMAIWNAPTRVAGHADLACLAALEARDRIARFNIELRGNGFPEFRTRFGLHLGEAVVGNVGSSDRMNYSAMGAAVNMASRIEGLNKMYGTDILVSQAVVERTRTRFVFRELDRVQPKGALTPVSVFELLGVRPGGGLESLVPPLSAADVAYAEGWNAAQHLLRRKQDPVAAGAAFAALASERPNDPVLVPFQVLCKTLAHDPEALANWDDVLMIHEK